MNSYYFFKKIMPILHDHYQISLKLLIKNSQNEVLLLKVENHSKYNGFYDFPGGRINEDEFETDVLEILNREVKEEIGQDLKFLLLQNNPLAYGRHEDFSRTYNKNVRYFYLLFEAEYLSGEVKISNEHVKFVWMPYDYIKDNLEKLFVSGLLECAQMYFK